jgi:hypothetical protein
MLVPQAATPSRRTRRSGVKVPRWSAPEEALLRDLVAQRDAGKDGFTWTVIAEELEKKFEGRSAQSVMQHWKIMEKGTSSANNSPAASPARKRGPSSAAKEPPHGHAAPQPKALWLIAAIICICALAFGLRTLT